MSIKNCLNTLKTPLIIITLIMVFADPVFAQVVGGQGTGGRIFANAACALLNQVLTKDFGGMITVVAGSLAILASVTGSFRGAWALVFVSVGCFIYPHTVDLLFPGMCT